MKHVNSIKPTWEHDCDRCIFLGTYQMEYKEVSKDFTNEADIRIAMAQHWDLYYCPAMGQDGGSVLARYGHDGPEYTSCRASYIACRNVNITVLIKAFEIALHEKELFTIEIKGGLMP